MFYHAITIKTDASVAVKVDLFGTNAYNYDQGSEK